MATRTLMGAFKRQAQNLKRITGGNLAAAQDSLARSYGFSDLHEMQQVVGARRADPRVRGVGVGPDCPDGHWEGWEDALSRQAERLAQKYGWTAQWARDVVARIHGFDGWEGLQAAAPHVDAAAAEIAEQLIHDELDSRLTDGPLSGLIATTNATGFYVADYHFRYAGFIDDTDRREIEFEAELTFSGEQDLDRTWVGDQIYAAVRAFAQLGEEGWELGDCEVVESTANFLTQDDDLYDPVE